MSWLESNRASNCIALCAFAIAAGSFALQFFSIPADIRNFGEMRISGHVVDSDSIALKIPASYPGTPNRVYLKATMAVGGGTRLSDQFTVIVPLSLGGEQSDGIVRALFFADIKSRICAEVKSKGQHGCEELQLQRLSIHADFDRGPKADFIKIENFF